jgi:hypothetical protein
MELYAGLDLHSRNTYIGIMDKAFNRVFKKRVPNHLGQIDLPPLFVPHFKLELVQYFLVKTITKKDQSVKAL